ncbi:MAG TPA: hypothetical protein VHV26_00585 [Rhizomicrobium sp.]|jgi:quercetin dioxygenase-like cupin family protein|nr:hypothetical protein [Rhizomicrobium sp.]
MISKILPAAAGMLALSVSAALAQAAGGHAAPPEPFIYHSDGDLQGMTSKPTLGPVLSVLSDHENYFVEVVGRTKSGEPEFHSHWIDYIIVQHGEGTLTYGGTDTGATGHGEMRGGTINGGKSMDLHPGDYFEMPAGVWHQISLKPGTTAFRYMVIKIRQ